MTRCSALLATDSSYPFSQGEVSRWCHELTRNLPEVAFTLLSVGEHAGQPLQQEPPPNIRRIVTMPMSGTADPAEFGSHTSFGDYLRRRWRTTPGAIADDYLPHLERFLQEVAAPEQTPRGLGIVLLEMHLHLRYCDYQRTHLHPAAGETFAAVMQEAWNTAHPGAPSPSVAELAAAWRWFGRVMLPLGFDVPRFDLSHATGPGSCGLPCVMAKLRWQTPYLLTEHAAWLRQQYETVPAAMNTPFLRWFQSRLTHTVAGVNYAFADEVTPACEATARWQRSCGVDSSRLHVIYNGASGTRFQPRPRNADRPPVVVGIGAFVPQQGQLDLIQAAALVRRRVAGVQFRLCGPPLDAAYHRRCAELIRVLDLQDVVSLVTDAPDYAAILAEADVAPFAFTDAGMPHAVIEAMLAEAVVVAPAVGGIKEALGDTGMLVPPSDPSAMADAIHTLILRPETRRRLGQQARQRALRAFSQEQFVEGYRAAYRRLTGEEQEDRPEPVTAMPSTTVLHLVHREPAPAPAMVAHGDVLADQALRRA